VWSSLTESQQADLLALRGLLASKFLLHALQKRHNVEFGISRRAATPVLRHICMKAPATT